MAEQLTFRNGGIVDRSGRPIDLRSLELKLNDTRVYPFDYVQKDSYSYEYVPPEADIARFKERVDLEARKIATNLGLDYFLAIDSRANITTMDGRVVLAVINLNYYNKK